jgi:serine/threonine protein kinase
VVAWGQQADDAAKPLHYTVQEYAQGRPATCIFGWQRMKATLRGVLLGLEHAHAQGLLHRDIKPDNVQVGDDGMTAGVKLIDWGMCWDMRPGARNPFPAFSVGTPSYMPLEQVLGQSQMYGPWSDLYAVGCLAHRMATGYAPLRGLSAAIVLDEAKRLALGEGTVPNNVSPGEWGPGFVRWVGWLLSIPIAQRPQSSREALDALDAIEGPPEQ